MQTRTEPMFSNRQLYQLIWPLITEQLLNVLVGMVDIIMVASLGEAAVSGVSLVDSMNQLVINLLAGLTAGGTVVCAQYLGRRDLDHAGRSAGQLISLTVVSTTAIAAAFLLSGTKLLRLIFGQADDDVMGNAAVYFTITAFSFPFLALYNSSAALFRAMGNSWVSMKTSLLMNGMNAAGNALCIYVLKMGVAGAALPTLAARMTASLILFALLRRNDAGMKLDSSRMLHPDWGMIRRILGLGIPGSVENSVFQLGKLMLQSLVSSMGTAAIAGFAVASNLVTFLYLPGNALGLGLTTVVGQCVGASEPEQALAYTRRFVMINYALLAVIAGGLAVGRFAFIGFYSLSAEAAQAAGGLVLSHCIAMIIWPLGFLVPHALRASNDVRYTMVVSIGCMWFFRVCLAYWFVRGLGRDIQYVWYAMYIDWVFRVIAYLPRFRGYAERVRKL